MYVRVCMYVCLCMCVRACVYVCVCMSVCVCTCACVLTRACVYVCVYMYVCLCVCARVCVCIHTYIPYFLEERPERSLKSRHSRGGAHSRGGGSFVGWGDVGRSFEFVDKWRKSAHTRNRETVVILEAELKKRKELFSHFDFTVENIPITRFPAALSKKYGS